MDPRHRLQRAILGDSVVVERRGTLRMAARAIVPEKKELIRAHREPLKVQVRNTKLRITPEPNAPQLIRIVRKPYRQETARPARVPLEQATLEPRSRVDVGEELRAARQEAQRVERPHPTRRARVGDRPRPDLSGWLATAPFPEELTR
jgi:hypothetical protein